MRCKILIVVALADKDILDQPGILLVRNGFQLFGEFAVDAAVLVASPDEQAHTRGFFAVDGAGVFALIRNTVAVNVDNGVGLLLQKAFCRLPTAAICAGVVGQMRRFVENDVNTLLLKRVAEFTRYIVYAALPVDALRAVGGNVTLVAVGDVHGDELFVRVRLRVCLSDIIRGKNRLRFADIQPRYIRHGFLADSFGDRVAVMDGGNAVKHVIAGDIFIAFRKNSVYGKQIRARTVYGNMQGFRVNLVICRCVDGAGTVKREREKKGKQEAGIFFLHAR